MRFFGKDVIYLRLLEVNLNRNQDNKIDILVFCNETYSHHLQLELSLFPAVLL